MKPETADTIIVTGGAGFIDSNFITSWSGFADAILKEAARLIPYALPPAARQARVVPISTAEYPRPARRPHNSLMSNGKLQETFGLVMPIDARNVFARHEWTFFRWVWQGPSTMNDCGADPGVLFILCAAGLFRENMPSSVLRPSEGVYG